MDCLIECFEKGFLQHGDLAEILQVMYLARDEMRSKDRDDLIKHFKMIGEYKEQYDMQTSLILIRHDIYDGMTVAVERYSDNIPNYQDNSSCDVVINPNPFSDLIPNTFTPNGDGINDFWKIKYIDKFNHELQRRFQKNHCLL